MSDRNLIPPADPALVGRIEQLTTNGTGIVSDGLAAHRAGYEVLRAAAAELDALRAENARLRAALEGAIHTLHAARVRLYVTERAMRAAGATFREFGGRLREALDG